MYLEIWLVCCGLTLASVSASEAAEKDAKFWNKVNLRKKEVPQGENDFGNDYVGDTEDVVVENSTEVNGLKVFYREAKARGEDTGQVSRSLTESLCYIEGCMMT